MGPSRSSGRGSTSDLGVRYGGQVLSSLLLVDCLVKK